MFCPTCGNPLQTLSVTTMAGGKFDVDHCGRCGGTWFDPFEINRIPFHEVTRLAKLTVLPHKLPSILPTDLCPHDHEKLIPADFDVSPVKVTMKKCPGCKGIWASQRQLEELVSEEEEYKAGYKSNTSIFPSLSVGFLPALFFFLFLATTFLTIQSVNESKTSAVRAENMISNLSIRPYAQNTSFITFRTSSPVKADITYGLNRFEFKTIPVSGDFRTVHAVILYDLKAGNSYLYRINLETEDGKRISTSLQEFTQQ